MSVNKENIFNTCSTSCNHLTAEIFPEGLKIQEKKGDGELQPLLLKLKKYKFNGYIKVMIKEQLEGHIVLKDGMPQNAVLLTTMSKKIIGLEALQKIQALDNLPDLHIEVHTKIDIDELISKAPGRLPTIKDGYGGIYAKIQEDELKEIIEEELVEELVKERGDDFKAKKEIEEKLKAAEREEREAKVYEMALRGSRGEKGVEVGVFSEKFTYNNFVVGPNNKFAFAAAREVSRRPGDKFNPLFITSPAGLGKTHLLKAIGYYVNKNHPVLRVEYNTTANFASQLTACINKDRPEELRNRYSKIHILLMDDVQFLAQRDEVQEELFYVFNDIKERGGQIVLTCDRPPENIPSLEDRLVSRFKSGLVVDIGKPTFETRLAVVDKILKEHDMTLDSDIKEYIARTLKNNIREIEGGFNRILAFSSLLDQEVTIESVKEMLQTHLSREKASETDLPSKPGHSYLIKDEKQKKSLKFLEGFSENDERSIYIFSRMNPKRIKRSIDVQEGRVYWLTAKESTAHKTVSPNLESITWRLEEILEGENIILLDGLEYLVSTSGFDATIQFIRHIVDCVSESRCIFLLPVKPGAFDKKEMSLLEREMEELPL